MKTIFIQYDDPFEPTIEESVFEQIKHSILKFIFSWIPKASPDYDDRLDNVVSWYLEINLENNRAEREVGFNSLRKAIVCAPTERNYGFWTDSDKVFDVNKSNIITEEEFDASWTSIVCEM